MASSNKNSVATEKDIEELKHDLLGTLATKEDIKKLATRDELYFKFNILDTRIDKLEHKIDNKFDIVYRNDGWDRKSIR